ncbi:hypothetical protein OG900_33165 [Streptomyces sp. NBC_00433]
MTTADEQAQAAADWLNPTPVREEDDPEAATPAEMDQRVHDARTT